MTSSIFLSVILRFDLPEHSRHAVQLSNVHFTFRCTVAELHHGLHWSALDVVEAVLASVLGKAVLRESHRLTAWS